jgi:hypothetical protein
MQLLWTRPCHPHAHASKAFRSDTGKLTLVDKNENELPDEYYGLPRCRAEWVVDIESRGRYHWESCHITQLKASFAKVVGRGKEHILIQQPSNLWSHQGWPIGTVNQATLSLRIGGYLLDCWRFHEPCITPVYNTPDFVLSFRLAHKTTPWGDRHPDLIIRDESCELKKDTSILSITLPVARDHNVLIGRVTFTMPVMTKTIKDRLLRYHTRYQDFFLDLHRTGRGQIASVAI